MDVGAFDVFGADADADDAGGDAAEDGKFGEQIERERESGDWFFVGEGRGDEIFVGEHLDSLSDASGEEAAIFKFVEVDVDVVFAGEYRGEDVGGGDGVLNGEIDANSADGRHGVGGVAEAE